MTSPQEKTKPTLPDWSSPRSPVASPWRRRVGTLIFLGLATALHSLVFVVPWPETAPVEEPEPEVLLEPEPPTISVSQLPPGSPELASKVAETAEKTTPPNQSARQTQRQTPAPRPKTAPQETEIETSEAEDVSETPEAPNINNLPSEDGSSQSSGGNETSSPTYVLDVVDEDLLKNPENGRELWALQDDFARIAANSQSVSKDEVVQNLSPMPLSLPICNSELGPDFLPNKVLVGIMLDSANTDISYGPQVMASSGSSELDELAKEETEKAVPTLQPDPNLDFPGWPKIYFILFTIDTDTNNCPSE